ncbi:hypothetical protein DFH06DRAFT_1353508 [Mycena polygramma]|nr:hypothetical protein DFH06DRAFT_1353508 [Mycena polygramma]
MSTNPPPYRDSDVDRLLADLQRLDLASSTQTLYRFESPVKSGYTAHWDEAAEHTQGIPGGHVSLVISNPRPRNRARAYAVFYGRIPGVYNTWEKARQQVDGASGSLFQGYPSTDDADAAYAYARARSWVRICGSRRRGPPARQSTAPIPVLPQPVALVDTPNPLHTGDAGAASPGRRWYVVYRGVTPGVYQSSLECGLNTCGISNAAHDSWGSRDVAIAKYQNALTEGRVRVITPPYRL